MGLGILCKQLLVNTVCLQIVAFILSLHLTFVRNQSCIASFIKFVAIDKQIVFFRK